MQKQKIPPLIQDIFCRIPPMISVFITICVLWAMALYMHRDIALSLMSVWMHDITFYHCFLVLPITIYLIWEKRKALDRIVPSFEPILLPLIIISGIGAMLFWRIGINILAHFSLIILLQSLMAICLGRQAFKVIAFPILFLLFMVPFGTEFIVPLQNLTANISVAMLRLSGIDVVYQGIHIITENALLCR